MTWLLLSPQFLAARRKQISTRWYGGSSDSAVEVMAQVWGCETTKGLTDKSQCIANYGQEQELTLPWTATDTGITKSSFGVYSVADSCATAVQPLNHVSNGHWELSWKPLKVKLWSQRKFYFINLPSLTMGLWIAQYELWESCSAAQVCSLPNPSWTHSNFPSSQGMWGWPWPHSESCCKQRMFAVQFCRTDPVNDLHLFHRGAVSERGLNIQGCFLDMHEFSLIVCLHAFLPDDLNFMWQT